MVVRRCFHDSECGVYYHLKCNAMKSSGNNQNVRHKFSEKSNLQKVIMIEYLSVGFYNFF
jgi:hypothetical protein